MRLKRKTTEDVYVERVDSPPLCPDHPASHTHEETDTWEHSTFPPEGQLDNFSLKGLNVPGGIKAVFCHLQALGDGQQPSSPAGRAFHAKSPTCHMQKDANPCEGGFSNMEQSYVRICSLTSKSSSMNLPKVSTGKDTKKT